MGRLFRGISGVLGAAAMLVSHQEADAQSTAPSAGGWELRRTAASCWLFRSFETVSGKLDLRIQSFGSTTPYHVILHGRGLPIRDNRAEIATVAFGEEADAERTITYVGQANGLPTVLLPASLPRPQPLNLMGFWFQSRGPYPRLLSEIDPAAEQFVIDYADSEPLVVGLGPMGDEYARLDVCAQELSDAWSRAASGDSLPSSGPRLLDPDVMRERLWFPPNLSMNRISGLVQLRMRVDANGRARDCVVQGWTGASQFGKHSCDAFERWSRFEPAKDADGKPVASLFRTAIMYLIYRW